MNPVGVCPLSASRRRAQTRTSYSSMEDPDGRCLLIREALSIMTAGFFRSERHPISANRGAAPQVIDLQGEP